MFTNLFIAYNEAEDFRVLVCAFDEEEAFDILREYSFDSNLKNDWKLNEAEKIDNIRFDCDYVLCNIKYD